MISFDSLPSAMYDGTQSDEEREARTCHGRTDGQSEHTLYRHKHRSIQALKLSVLHILTINRD